MHRPLRMMSLPLQAEVKDTYSASEHPEIRDQNGLSDEFAFEALGKILEASEVLNIPEDTVPRVPRC